MGSLPSSNVALALTIQGTKDSDGNVVPLPVKDNVASITIADEPIPGLPLTAGSGIWMLVGFGGTLITAAVLLFAYQLRKRSQLS
ncbi:MAG: hypothetical protein E6191_06895 [Atopobium sp.]|nr:hypothetical protein [Atopobium sp.]